MPGSENKHSVANEHSSAHADWDIFTCARVFQQIWVALGDNLAAVEVNLQSYGPDQLRSGLLSGFYVARAWNVVSAVLGETKVNTLFLHGILATNSILISLTKDISRDERPL